MKTNKVLLFTALILTSFAANSVSALEVVFSEHRDTVSFQRITEFVTGDENPGRYMIARTNPDLRDGFYIGLKIEKTDPVDTFASARISFVKSASQEIHTETATITGKTKKRLLVGLTNEEWSNKDLRPQAWKVEILDASGTTIDSVQSFLWSLDQ